MKAAIYDGIKKVRLGTRPDLKAGPGQVVVKVKYCGICGTDIHSYLLGGRATDLVLGHEVVGTVAEIGTGVTGWQIGDRVVVGPPGSCGECYQCRHGRPNMCSLAFTRTAGISAGHDGGMAEYILVRLPRTALFKIPDNVSFEDAVLIDTITVAFHGIRVSNFKIADNVVVAGAGAIGLSAIQFFRIGGARHITVLQRSAAKREFALKFGADVGFNPAAEGAELPKKINALYNGIGADIAAECAGTPESFQQMFNLVRGCGQILVIGVTTEPAAVTEQQFVRREVDVKGALVYTDEDIVLCLDYLAQKRFNTKGMVSDIISLDDAVTKGFERLSTNKDLIKVLIAPNG